MLDGDKFWNLRGIWEKSIELGKMVMEISLMLTIVIVCAVVLAIVTMTSPVIGSLIYCGEEIKYDWVDGICTCSVWGPENTEGSQCRFQLKLSSFIVLTTMVIMTTHCAGLVFFVFSDPFSKKNMEFFATTVLGWNRNLILVLIGPQFYVSYKIQNLIFRLYSTCNCYCLVITYLL